MIAKVLLLEDDFLFGESLQDFLEEEGMDVHVCRNGQEAMEITYREHFDLYLLDINVPLVNGLELLKDLRRAEDTTPAIFLTSYQDKETMVKGFGIGADDYLKKPFDMDELMLRITAVLRRIKGKPALCVGSLCMDEEHRSVTLKGRELALTVKEFQLLSLMMRNVGQVVTKEIITQELWSTSENVSSGAIRVYINRLKSELGPEKIENIRGVGYRLVS